jgi:hypothetical protein
VFWIWRHLVRRLPITYHPMYWSLVFPLGMYTVATYRLSVAADLAVLKAVPQVTLWVALAVWSLTMAGLVGALFRGGAAPPAAGSIPGAAGVSMAESSLVQCEESGSRDARGASRS